MKLLQQESGTEFHFAADPKRIDPLVATCLARVWTNDLPVIVLCAVIDCLDRLTCNRQTQ